MFTASTRTARFAGFAFAAVMAVVVNGSMLMKFDNAATQATAAHNHAHANHAVAVLETVTIVGRRS